MVEEKVYKKFVVDDILGFEDSWDVVQPMYWTINIYDSYEEYLRSAEGFTVEQRYLFAIVWYFIEVCNGGHEQFFSNSTGIVWDDVLSGFRLFGMSEFADNLQRVVDYLGGVVSFDRDERNECISRLVDLNEDEFCRVFDEVNDFVVGYEGAESEMVFVRANPEKFVFDGFYYEPRF